MITPSRNPADFLVRWSRLKRAGGSTGLVAPPPGAEVGAGGTAVQSPVAALPDAETLGFDADFSAFLHREVEEAVKRTALKKLFHSPHFNVMDGLDTYIDDYTLADPLDEATLRTLNQARGLLFDPAEESAATAMPDEAIETATQQPAAGNNEVVHG